METIYTRLWVWLLQQQISLLQKKMDSSKVPLSKVRWLKDPGEGHLSPREGATAAIVRIPPFLDPRALAALCWHDNPARTGQFPPPSLCRPTTAAVTAASTGAVKFFPVASIARCRWESISAKVVISIIRRPITEGHKKFTDDLVWMKYKIESSEPAKVSSLPFSVIYNPFVSLQKFSDVYDSDFIDINSHTTNRAKYLTRQLVLEASVQISSDHILDNVFSVIELQPCSSMWLSCQI